MAWTTVRSPAKVNLFLELIARRKDGFHELDTFMVRVGLFDRLSFRPRDDGVIRIAQLPSPGSSVPHIPVPLDRSNLIWRAIEQLGEKAGRPLGMDVVVEKHIPARAGFGGGSGNAVTTLITIDRLLRLGLGQPVLTEIANTLGSDLAFFFAPSSARCRGRGEQVAADSGYRRLWLVLGMPPRSLLTGDVFAHSQAPQCPMDGSWIARRWTTAPLEELAVRMHNRLQYAARSLSGWIEVMREQFNRVGCVAHQMSGSGSGWFGLFEHRSAARRAAALLASRTPQARFYCVATVAESPATAA